jgi:hypothetical protein
VVDAPVQTLSNKKIVTRTEMIRAPRNRSTSNRLQVSDFQQSAAKTFTDSLVDEIQSATIGFRELLEYTNNMLPC